MVSYQTRDLLAICADAKHGVRTSGTHNQTPVIQNKKGKYSKTLDIFLPFESSWFRIIPYIDLLRFLWMFHSFSVDTKAYKASCLDQQTGWLPEMWNGAYGNGLGYGYGYTCVCTHGGVAETAKWLLQKDHTVYLEGQGYFMPDLWGCDWNKWEGSNTRTLEIIDFRYIEIQVTKLYFMPLNWCRWIAFPRRL